MAGVGASEFRTLLDRLRASLAASRRPSDSAPHVPDTQEARIVHTLKVVLGALQRAPRNEGELGVSPYAHDAPRVRGVVDAVRRSLEDYLRVRMGSRKLEVLCLLLAKTGPDLLGVIQQTERENSHSDVIRWLLDPSEAPNIAPKALGALVEVLDKPPKWRGKIEGAISTRTLSVRRECSIVLDELENIGRIDLLVSGPDFLLAIENKVWSLEHEDQTVGYSKWIAGVRGLSGAIFLTPVGIPAQSRAFKPISYLDLLSCLLEAPTTGSLEPVEEIVLAAYAKTLAAGVLNTELRHILELGVRP